MKKKLMHWMIALAMVSAAAAVPAQWLGSREAQKKMNEASDLFQRQELAQKLTLEMERYRRLYGSFRKMDAGEIASAKNQLKSRFSDALKKLDELNPTEKDKELSTKVNDKLSELMVLAAKLEPQLFTKDVYQKAEVRELHDSLLKTLAMLQDSAAQRVEQVQPETQAYSQRALRVSFAIAGASIFFMLTIVLLQYLTYARPLAQLLKRVRLMRDGQLPPHNHKPSLRGVYGEIEQSLGNLATAVGNHRMERHQFLTSIAKDLRSPLVALQAEASWIVSANDVDKQKMGMQAMKRSILKLTGILDDLSDLAESNQGDTPLDEKIIELGSLLERASDRIRDQEGGCHVTVATPKGATWALIDAQRVERVVISLVSKLMKYSPSGARVTMSLSRVRQDCFRGVEIHIHEDPNFAGGQRATGPEQEITKHWVSENGFGLGLANKIIRAHGGTLTAAGVSGAGVQFRIRLPEERIANTGQTGVEPASPGLATVRASALESARIQSMFPEQTVYLGT